MLIVMAVGALIAIGVYVQRAVRANLKMTEMQINAERERTANQY